VLPLARPSLFARLWRESEIPSPPSLAVEETAERKDDHLALQRHIEGLLELGNLSDWHLEPIRSGFRSRFRIHGKLACPRILSTEKGIWLQNALRAQAGIKEGECLHSGRGATRARQ
jgi:hypothetical protein